MFLGFKKHFDYFDANAGHANFGAGRWAETPETFKDLSKGREALSARLRRVTR